MTINEFIAGNKLQLAILPAHENPCRTPADQANAIHWSCQLINEDNRSFVVYFSKGPGLRVWIEADISGEPPVPVSKVGTTYDGPKPPFDNERQQEIFLRRSAAETPRIDEVLACIVNDIRAVETSLGFDDWCSSFKWSIDSRHAKKCYEVILEQAMKLRALVGQTEYEILLHNVEIAVSSGLK